MPRSKKPFVVPPLPEGQEAGSETRQQALVRLEAAQKGIKLWRNNVGVLPNAYGRPVRFGLANESKELNKLLKSADLIGWETRLITPDMVGRFVAVFVSVETKKEDWSPGEDAEREEAQKRWADMVIAAGGRALIVKGPGSL